MVSVLLIKRRLKFHCETMSRPHPGNKCSNMGICGLFMITADIGMTLLSGTSGRLIVSSQRCSDKTAT